MSSSSNLKLVFLLPKLLRDFMGENLFPSCCCCCEFCIAWALPSAPRSIQLANKLISSDIISLWCSYGSKGNWLCEDSPELPNAPGRLNNFKSHLFQWRISACELKVLYFGWLLPWSCNAMQCACSVNGCIIQILKEKVALVVDISVAFCSQSVSETGLKFVSGLIRVQISDCKPCQRHMRW